MTSSVVTCSPGDSLEDVLKRMREGPISCIPVVRGDRPVGILTERDVVRMLGTEPLEAILDFDVAEAMTSPVIAVRRTDSVEDALEVAYSCEIRHLPVVDENDKLVGIVTQSDLVTKYLLSLSRSQGH